MTTEISARLAAKAEQINQRLRTLFATDEAYLQTFFAASDHAVMGGGKRVRPVLTLLVAEACGNPCPEDAVNAAVAIELLHSYTLVHDDLPSMDNDTLRRGQPTVWAKYGEATAVLAGDYLQARAFAQIAYCERAGALLPVLTRAATEVIHGQVADIDATHIPSAEWDVDLMMRIYGGKTCALIAAACQLGAIAADAAPEQVAAAYAYGYNVGMAFQLIDDLLDADQAKEGNEFNALAVHANDPEQVKASASAFTTRAIAAADALPGDTTLLKRFAESLLERTL
ncbi:MAG: polyprenyl synthetase family protein [Kiritimatiellae bacterium]|nr:polyprenyl synthetase family protein [Kiritimatiellia bacterium]